jgi:hypothetical protein
MGRRLSAELRDTFQLYGSLPPVSLLCEEEFLELRRPVRAALVRLQRREGRDLVPSVRSAPQSLRRLAGEQADGHRFVYWRSMVGPDDDQLIIAYLEDGRRPSRHDQVPTPIWRDAAEVLPGARALAGRFPTRSGPNCFGTIIGAAGRLEAADRRVEQPEFEAWLDENTVPGGGDLEPGTVWVWRAPDGLAVHAAVTIGSGYLLHKPSQGWMSPWKILTAAECKASSRDSGRRLHRYALDR